VIVLADAVTGTGLRHGKCCCISTRANFEDDQLPVGKKTVIDLLGDVGGWGATAKLDYQFATLLGYKICPKWTLVAGYRYLFVDYHNGPAGIFNVVTSGALLGATYTFK
jgi:hypothetical protein